MKTLADLCKPRASVFDKARLDTVYNLDDLPTIDPDDFLSENYVTEGMRILLTEAFNRLEGKTTSASGTFLLSQSMGGGKTHNLITLGLLAKYPKYRKQVMADFFKPGDEFVVTVVSRNNFKEIDANSIIKKELAKPIVTGIEALSDGAKEMLDWLKGNMTGRPKRDIADIYGSGQFGTYAETQAKWQEIMKNVPYTKDGKTLDFSEA